MLAKCYRVIVVILTIGVMNTLVVFHQSSSLVVCEVDASLQEKLKKFRFRKETSNAAILSEFHRETNQCVVRLCGNKCTSSHTEAVLLGWYLLDTHLMHVFFSEDRYGETAGHPGGRV